MTPAAKAALQKRLVELLIAALTALITALATSCSIKWSSNSFDLVPRGVWKFGSEHGSEVPSLPATNAPKPTPD